MGLFLFNSRKRFKLDSVIALSCSVSLSPFGLEEFFPLPLAVMTLNISGQFWGRRSISCFGLYLLPIRFGLCVSGGVSQEMSGLYTPSGWQLSGQSPRPLGKGGVFQASPLEVTLPRFVMKVLSGETSRGCADIRSSAHFLFYFKGMFMKAGTVRQGRP